MLRRHLVAVALLAGSIGAFGAATGPAGAVLVAHKTVTMTGTISCSVSGTLKMSPALTTSTPTSTKISLSLKATGCTGDTSQGGATIVSGKISGSVTTTTDCADLVLSVPDPTGSIAWTTTGNKAAATKFTLSGGSSSFATGDLVLSYDSAQTGSFAGSGSVTSTVDSSLSTLLGECGSKKGLSKVTIASGTVD